MVIQVQRESCSMFALEPPAVARQAQQQEDVIEVVGKSADQILKIDRRTYRVQETPHAAQKDAVQLLRGLPAVTISPDDQVNLLGSANVKITIDGHETRTSLHSLHGTDIERIEIITNPSAQYSAVGTAGIINIVLRKKRADGLSGNASAQGSSLGRANADVTLKYKRRKWTYESEVEGFDGTWNRSSYHKHRSVEQATSGPATINSEDGGGSQRAVGAAARAKVTYELDTKTSLSAETNAGGSNSSSTGHADFRGLTPDFIGFSDRQRGSDRGSFLTGLLSLDHKGAREGETLKASLWAFGNPYHRSRNDAVLGDGSSLSNETREGSLFSYNKIDWEHPIGKKEILSMGAEWDLLETHQRHRFMSAGLPLGGNRFDEYRGRESTLSAYATFQRQIGAWAVMPGFRMEQNSRRIMTPGLADVRVRRTNLFPTFHVEHPLSKELQLTLSYSRRIDRPYFDLLRPYPVQDVLTIGQGNPSLRDQSTDSYEINLHYHRGKLDAGLIAYNRITRDAWDSNYTVNSAGQNVSSWVNAGRKRDSGAQIDLSTPIVCRVKAVLSVNLFDTRVSIDGGSGSDERFRFTTNSTLEWDGPDRRGKPGDVAQLQWQFGSPQRSFQMRNFAWNWLTLSYTHSFDKGLSLTATADTGALHNGHRLLAPLVQEFYASRRRAEFKLKLLKTFGKL